MRNLRMPIVIATCVVLAGSAVAIAAKPPAAQRNFVACPIVRDTKTVPCWLAEYQGETYFLGIQQDIGAKWLPPQLNHMVLVEGTVTGERACGGIVLKPIRTSPLPEISKQCNTLLPAEDGIEAPHAERGAGPSTVKPGSQPPRVRSEPPQPPYAAKTYAVPFDFDNTMMAGYNANIVGEAIRYARLTEASRIEVIAHRGATLLSDGQNYIEAPATAQARARKIEEILLGVGIPATALKIRWNDKAERSDGVSDTERRVVTLIVTPGKAERVSQNP